MQDDVKSTQLEDSRDREMIASFNYKMIRGQLFFNTYVM